jgi:restriction system protein
VTKQEIKMAPITRDIDEVHVTLKSIKRNKVFDWQCKDHSIDCRLRQQLTLIPTGGQLIATEALFNVRNTSPRDWPVSSTDWELVDTDGYAYKARTLCDTLRPPKTADLQMDFHVTSGTQADLLLLFPELERRKEIASIFYSNSTRGQFEEFEIRRMKPKAKDLSEARRAAKSYEPNFRAGRRMAMASIQVEKLEGLVKSRLEKTWAPSDGAKRDDRIDQLAGRIGEDLRLRMGTAGSEIETKFQQLMMLYKGAIPRIKAREEQRKSLDLKVEQLRRGSPREFEDYVADVFRNLEGFQDVELTPQSNDRGVDIRAHHKGAKVAIQCKRHKGTIGAPTIQAFVGAMNDDGADKGFLVITSVFTLSAERMATDHPIELIDGTRRKELILEAKERMASDDPSSLLTELG